MRMRSVGSDPGSVGSGPGSVGSDPGSVGSGPGSVGSDPGSVGRGSYRQRPLQLSGDGAEAVEHEVLSDAVDPLAARRQRAAHEVSALPLTGAEAPHDLHTHTHVKAGPSPSGSRR